MKQYFKWKALILHVSSPRVFVNLNLISNKLEITTKCNKRLGEALIYATSNLESFLKGFASTLKLLSFAIVSAISGCQNNKTTFYPPHSVRCFSNSHSTHTQRESFQSCQQFPLANATELTTKSCSELYFLYPVFPYVCFGLFTGPALLISYQ